ncbi:MAG: glycosyltransferase [Pseudomonadota bacterium]|nr:glycosyltransferase [Pseudomonadota bacterium]
MRHGSASNLPLEPAEALRISVVIPTYRRPDLLCRCLAAVFAQRLERSAFEVIVVDDGHTADTQAVVDAFRMRPDGPVLRFIRPKQGRGPAVARNAGWRAAYGKLIAFTDDDTIPDPDWLAEGERAFLPGLVALCGRVSVPPAAGAAVRGGYRPTDHELMTRGLESAEFVTANAFVRRSALLTVGGFDERFQRAWREDSDLQFRLLRDAGPVGRSKTAVVLHPVRAEPWGVCLRQQKNVFFDALLYKKHPRLYRERILPSPPWNYYAIVGLTLAAPALWFVDIGGSAVVSLLFALGGVLRLAAKRLRRTSHTPGHVGEMVLTSALIPFLSVYWRLRGAIHFRVLFL